MKKNRKKQKMTLVEIEKIVQKYQKKPPIRVFDLARALGIKVFKAHDWENDVSGLIKKKWDGNYVIMTNAKHPTVRRRFTVAHEIAHFALHRDLVGDGIADDALYRSGLGGSIERQANNYAANLLMPWHLITSELEKGINSIEELAEKFKVSKTAMSIRLGIPWE